MSRVGAVIGSPLDGCTRFRTDIISVRAIGLSTAGNIILNVTRGPHATVPASSTSRPFELAACGAAIVSNPHEGIERWFAPGRELVVVTDADEALATYREALAISRALSEDAERIRAAARSGRGRDARAVRVA